MAAPPLPPMDEASTAMVVLMTVGPFVAHERPAAYPANYAGKYFLAIIRPPMQLG